MYLDQFNYDPFINSYYTNLLCRDNSDQSESLDRQVRLVTSKTTKDGCRRTEFV